MAKTTTTTTVVAEFVDFAGIVWARGVGPDWMTALGQATDVLYRLPVRPSVHFIKSVLKE